jgi:hypothetical protein
VKALGWGAKFALLAAIHVFPIAFSLGAFKEVIGCTQSGAKTKMGDTDHISRGLLPSYYINTIRFA